SLDQLGYFRKPGIIWLGPSSAPVMLYDLVEALSPPDFVRTCFVPHITLWRGARAWRNDKVDPIQWPVDAFSLVESGVEGVPGTYRVIATWHLLEERINRTQL